MEQHRFVDLPTFGGEAPADTHLVWSWDAESLLVGEAPRDWKIVSREDWIISCVMNDNENVPSRTTQISLEYDSENRTLRHDNITLFYERGLMVHEAGYAVDLKNVVALRQNVDGTTMFLFNGGAEFTPSDQSYECVLEMWNRWLNYRTVLSKKKS